jgi:DNA modification methylase
MLNENQEYAIHAGDCIPHMLTEMEPDSMDMAVFSPPFPSLYSYTSEACDIGNSENLRTEAKLHLSWFYRGLRRVLKPGRVAAVHVTQIVRLKRSGDIRLGERAGLVFEYDWLIRKNPQSQAIRTRSRELQFAGFDSDRARCRGANGDYIIKFRAPGDNAIPVANKGESSRNDWIQWAEACWFDIRETDTLNVAEGRGENDTKHICPLQLPVIERLIKLYTNPGEIVFSPFAGIGSEGYEALKLGRRFYGCEIKKEYLEAMAKNLERAKVARQESEASLFDFAAK